MLHDLAAVERFADTMGFVISPPMGVTEAAIENRILTLQTEAIDLMMIQKRGVLPGDLDGVLDTREGLFGLIFRVDEDEKVRAAEKALKRFGFQAVVVEGQRPEVQPDGSVLRARWIMCGSLHPTSPLFRIFVCRHYDHDIFFRPALKTHSNGATRTSRILAAAKCIEEYEPMIRFLFGDEYVCTHDAGLQAKMADDVELLVFTPDALRERYEDHVSFEGHDQIYIVGQEIRVASLDTVLRMFNANGVPHVQLRDRRILVPPAFFGNVAWTFSASD